MFTALVVMSALLVIETFVLIAMISITIGVLQGVEDASNIIASRIWGYVNDNR